MSLNDRKYRSIYRDTSTGAESYATETANPNTEFATGLAAKYTSSSPSPTDGDWVFLRTDANGYLKTTASISGDVNVDSNSVDTSGMIGKASGTNGDFVTAYASTTAFTCSTLPGTITQVTADDIVAVVAVNSAGVVSQTLTRDDVGFTSSGTDPSTIVISEGLFDAYDTFIVYTNIDKNPKHDGSVASVGLQNMFEYKYIDGSSFTTVSTEGDAVRGAASSAGVQYTQLTNSDGSQTFEPVAHDSADSGAPLAIGGIAQSSQQTSVAASDRVKAVFNLFGELVVAGYDWASGLIKVAEQDPLSSHHVEETLAAVTDGADETYYYYIDMDGYTGLNLHGEISGGAAGTVAVTFEATWQDDGTAPASCAYQDITEFGFDDILDGTANSSYSNADFVVAKKANVNPKYVRAAVSVWTNGADDGDWTIYSKKWY